MPFSVNPDRCIGCRVCLNICPVNALLFIKEENKVDCTELCLECYDCITLCPFRAISD